MTFESSLDISIRCPQFEFNPNSFYDFSSYAVILLPSTWVNCHVLHKYALPWWHSSDKKIFLRHVEWNFLFFGKRKKEVPSKHKSKHEESKSCRVSATVDFRLSHFHYQGNYSSCFSSFGCAPTYPTYSWKLMKK